MKIVKLSIFHDIHGRKMYNNSLYYIKAQNKYMAYQNGWKNLPIIVSFMNQKAHKISAVSKWAMLRPDRMISGVFLGHHIAFCYSHLTVYLSPVNLSVA